MRRSFRITPELRRCCWYTMAGCLLLSSVAWWVGQQVPGRDATPPILFLTSVAIAMTIPLVYRLDVDEAGITRNTVFSSEIWQWSDFASGRIRKLLLHRFVDPERPWWKRKLGLDALSISDRTCLLKLINEHYRLPPPPNVPKQMELSVPLQGSLMLTSRGLLWKKGRRSREYAWTDVVFIHVDREDERTRLFRSLVFVLPDREFPLQVTTRHGVVNEVWKGPSSEVIHEFLLRHCPQDRLVVTSISSGMPSHPFALRRLSRIARSDFRTANRICLTACALFVLALAWIAIADGVLKAVVIGVSHGLLGVPLLVSVRQRTYRRYAEIQSRLAPRGGNPK